MKVSVEIEEAGVGYDGIGSRIKGFKFRRLKIANGGRHNNIIIGHVHGSDKPIEVCPKQLLMAVRAVRPSVLESFIDSQRKGA